MTMAERRMNIDQEWTEHGLTFEILKRMSECEPHERTDRDLAKHFGEPHHNYIHRRVIWLYNQGFVQRMQGKANTRRVTREGLEELRWQARFQ
jgi:hypothetical protein